MDYKDLIKLDQKDYEILRELDYDFSSSFSKIGKKVKLSKNSVALRYDKLKKVLLHNLVGINTKKIGYTEIKVYYSFDFFNEESEKQIKKEMIKYKNIVWAARYYGNYDLCILFLVDNINDFIIQLNRFNQKFAAKINQKDIEIVSKAYYFRYNFLHEKSIPDYVLIKESEKPIKLTEIDRKLLKIMRFEPRISIIQLAEKLNLSPKTVSNKIKDLENKKIITGYFISLDCSKFNHQTFNLLIQLKNHKIENDFEKYIIGMKNIKYIEKMTGTWDYQIDMIYPNMLELQKKIESIKENFPNAIKKLAILSFGKRIATNKDNYPI
ncbi:MAG: Lrp/AsnC family transcriptional regulator [Candidatus Pacearchaeota archaeon]|jgi:Lrp/AsnC family leucine-responsive transcriptional regulator